MDGTKTLPQLQTKFYSEIIYRQFDLTTVRGLYGLHVMQLFRQFIRPSLALRGAGGSGNDAETKVIYTWARC